MPAATMASAGGEAPPPRLHAAWTMLREVRSPQRSAQAHRALTAPQVVTSASAALEDVTRLHQVDPGLDPAVRARALRAGWWQCSVLTGRPCVHALAQVTTATHKRLRGRAAAQLRDAQARLRYVASQARPSRSAGSARGGVQP